MNKMYLIRQAESKGETVFLRFGNSRPSGLTDTRQSSDCQL